MMPRKKSYDTKVEAAHKEAERRWNNAREAARKKAEAENAQNSSSGGGFLGSLLSGVSQGLHVANAVNAVKFDPYFDQVKAERDLLVPPDKPYNPLPKEPKEPSDGYEWKKYALLQPCPYDEIDFNKISDADGFAEVRSGKLYGLVDAYLNPVIKCNNKKSVNPKWLTDTRCLVFTDDGYGVIDNKGKFIINPQYQSFEKCGANYIVSKNNKFGLIDGTGKAVIPLRFTKITGTSTNEFICQDENGCGIYTSSFDELYPCQYQSISLGTINGKRFMNVQQKGLWGTMDFQNGQQLLPIRYDKISVQKISDNESVFSVTKDQKIGLYSSNGVILLPVEFSNINLTDNGFKVTSNDNTVGLFSQDGFEIIPTGKYSDFTYYKDGYFEVKDKNGKLGIVLPSGEEVIPCKYLSLSPIEKGNYFYYAKKELVGFMATTGTDKFRQRGIVSLLGEEMFPFKYCDQLSIHDNFIIFKNWDKKSYKYGIMDYDGNVVVEPKLKYDKVYKKLQELTEKKYSGAYSTANTKREMFMAAGNNMLNAIKEDNQQKNTFSYFAQNYVERIVNEWQKRGEFEKKEDWSIRVNNQTRQQKVYELTRDAQKTYIEKRAKLLPADNPSIVGQYDADNETFRLSSAYSSAPLLVHVSPEDAQDFKTQFSSMSKKPIFFVENDNLGLAEYSFHMTNGKLYKYSNQTSLNYTVANVDYKFDEIIVDTSSINGNIKKGKQTISSSQLSIGTSDVDVAIPNALTQQPNTYALIIANELYSNEKNVDYAFNDGQVFREYCIRTLGIPESNVQFRANATLNDMRFDMNWLKQIANVKGEEAKIIVYYAGHGMPDDASREAYLLPVDGFSSDLNSGLKLSDFYATLSSFPSENVTVFLDACFSGSQRTGEVLANVRGVAITPQIATPKGNLLVFAAASGKETAQSYHEKRHGLFTYYLLKKLKEHQGELMFGDLYQYVTKNVQQTALSGESRKIQTPNVTASSSISKWQDIRVK